jgi:signal transduction histidine kinase/catechol 2,3-dioxygenase-like lactoylglutathione lyase family enzyme
MTIQRMDHVGIVVEDLAGAVTFFLELGLELELHGEAPVEGDWVDRVVGLEGVRAQIAMLQTPDGHGRVELTKFHTPSNAGNPRRAPANAPGIRHVAFAVEDIDAVLARLRAHGAELVGELGRYRDRYRLCHVRGPEGIIVELAQPIGPVHAEPEADSHAGLARLVREHDALRRVATLVARGGAPEEIFAVVTEQAAGLLEAEMAALGRFENRQEMTMLATWARDGEPPPAGVRYALEGENISAEVSRTGRPARRDNYDSATGPLADTGRGLGARQGVASPVVVEGKLWGVLALFTARLEPLPADTEARLADFTDLLATAVANAESRAELAASRARIVAATDDARRRIERDLHDGAQQRLVSLALELRAAEAEIPPELSELSELLAGVVRGLVDAQRQLQEIARGIHPASLTEGGLEPALKALARRSPIPVELSVSTGGRLREQVEVAAYYVVSEALTNAAKHGRPSLVNVEVALTGSSVKIIVRDDGVGGADPRQGSGLVGLRDRVETLGGRMLLDSPPGAGTTVDVELPVDPG